MPTYPETVKASLFAVTPESLKAGRRLGTNKVQEDASVILTDNLLEMLAKPAKAK